MKATNKAIPPSVGAVKDRIRRFVSPPSKENLGDGSPKSRRPSQIGPSQERRRGSPKNADEQRRSSALRADADERMRESALLRSNATERLRRPPIASHRPSAVCLNHSHKRAMFKVEEGAARKLLCGKCALIFSKQGIDCGELSEDEQSERHERLYKCLTLLKGERRRAEALNAELAAKAARYAEGETAQLRQINQHFDALVEHAQRCRAAEVKRARDARAALKAYARGAAAELKKTQSELAEFEDDIEQNFDNIVQKVEMDVFDVIIGRYESRIAAFDAFARSLLAQTVDAPSLPPTREAAADAERLFAIDRSRVPLFEERGAARASNSAQRARASVSASESALSAPRLSPLPSQRGSGCFLEESAEIVADWTDRCTPELAGKAAKLFESEQENARYNKSLFAQNNS